jgi:murein DD-endopeptidase MepM/ murein hydrolase activator NlpD
MQGITWADMPALISNPYHPPPPGSDDPHQGVDFADTGPDRIALQGRGVQAVMDGTIAAVIADRFPYGNALLVESPVEKLSASWRKALNLPALAPTLAAIPALTCPTGEPLEYNTQKRSLYLLYAHMEAPPALKPGEAVACGQAIGTVGMSGNALNPHLHLEVRIGPSGIQLESMAHYDNSATDQEMANYCLWRVSGLFQLVDPMNLWSPGNP